MSAAARGGAGRASATNAIRGVTRPEVITQPVTRPLPVGATRLPLSASGLSDLWTERNIPPNGTNNKKKSSEVRSRLP